MNCALKKKQNQYHCLFETVPYLQLKRGCAVHVFPVPYIHSQSYCVLVSYKAAFKEVAFTGVVLNFQHSISVHEMVLITQLPFSLRIKNPN